MWLQVLEVGARLAQRPADHFFPSLSAGSGPEAPPEFHVWGRFALWAANACAQCIESSAVPQAALHRSARTLTARPRHLCLTQRPRLAVFGHFFLETKVLMRNLEFATLPCELSHR